MKLNETNRILWTLAALGLALLLCGCGCLQEQETPETPAAVTAGDSRETEETGLTIAAVENREGEPVFNLSLEAFIRGCNACYGGDFLPPRDFWRQETYPCSPYSDRETRCFCFVEDENLYSLPMMVVYLPAEGDIQAVTVNYDQHSYTELGFRLYRQMCACTLKVFFPDLSEAAVTELLERVMDEGNQNTFSSEEWFGRETLPRGVYCGSGIGVYPYFAVGDWDRICIIPLTEARITQWKQKGVEFYEME